MVVLTGKTLVAAVRPPYSYGDEFVQQFLFALRLCWFPMIVTSVAFSYGPVRDPGRRTSSTCSARSTASAACSCSS